MLWIERNAEGLPELALEWQRLDDGRLAVVEARWLGPKPPGLYVTPADCFVINGEWYWKGTHAMESTVWKAFGKGLGDILAEAAAESDLRSTT